MLSPSELTSLYNIISDDTKSFEVIAANFQKTYSKIDQFKVGVTLWFLIKDNLLNLSQRLASFYILYDMYRNEKVTTTTPFIPIVLETLQTSSNKVEQKLLINFIENSINYQKTVIKAFKEETIKNNETVEIPDLKQYWNAHYVSTGKQGNEINDWIRPVIYDKGEDKKKDIDTMPLFNLSHLSQEEVSFNFFEPNYLTYYPNSNYPFLEDEPMWIIPTLKYDFIWDFTMSPEQDNLSAILNRPLNNKPITDEQITYALEIIGNNPNILKEIHFTPDSLMKMVDKKDQFASDILLKISTHVLFQE